MTAKLRAEVVDAREIVEKTERGGSGVERRDAEKEQGGAGREACK